MENYYPNMIGFVVVLWVLFTKYVDFINEFIVNLVYQSIMDYVDVFILNMKC